jgi:hypothetical protein
LTPFVAAVIPSHHYENVGEAVVGRRLGEVAVGLNAGRSLAPYLPRGYVEGRYAYAFVQRDLGIPLNRSNAIIDLGYSLIPSVTVRAIGTWQRTHGGLRGFPEFGTSVDLLQNHDRLLRDNNERLGGGVIYGLSRSIDLSATVITVLGGTSTHYGAGITAGMNWSFNRGMILTSSAARRRLNHLSNN